MSCSSEFFKGLSKQFPVINHFYSSNKHVPLFLTDEITVASMHYEVSITWKSYQEVPELEKDKNVHHSMKQDTRSFTSLLGFS